MKYAYIIFDADGKLSGTNDSGVAKAWKDHDDDAIIIDCEKGADFRKDVVFPEAVAPENNGSDSDG